MARGSDHFEEHREDLQGQVPIWCLFEISVPILIGNSYHPETQFIKIETLLIL